MYSRSLFGMRERERHKFKDKQECYHILRLAWSSVRHKVFVLNKFYEWKLAHPHIPRIISLLSTYMSRLFFFFRLLKYINFIEECANYDEVLPFVKNLLCSYFVLIFLLSMHLHQTMPTQKLVFMNIQCSQYKSQMIFLFYIWFVHSL